MIIKIMAVACLILTFSELCYSIVAYALRVIRAPRGPAWNLMLLVVNAFVVGRVLGWW